MGGSDLDPLKLSKRQNGTENPDRQGPERTRHFEEEEEELRGYSESEH